MALTIDRIRQENPELYAGLSDKTVIDHFAKTNFSHVPFNKIAKLFDYEDPDAPGDFVRGFKNTGTQLKQTGYGLLAGGGATAEHFLGEGGISTAVKNVGVKGYLEKGEELAATSKESDSLTYSLDAAKQGDFGALVDWVQAGLGQAAGQGLQLVATGFIGGAIAKGGLGFAANEVTQGLVTKEAARITADQVSKIASKEAVKELTTAEIAKLATSNIAEKMANIGSTAAVGAMAFGQEGGEIGGGLVSKAEQEGRKLTGSELANGFIKSIESGATEFVGDKIGLDLIKGKSALFKAAPSMIGAKGMLARGAIAGTAAAPIEGGEEYVQTLLEESGKGNDPFSAATLRQAKDAFGVGALGGTAMAGVGGFLSKPVNLQPIAQAKTTDEAIAAASTAITGQPIAGGSIDDAIVSSEKQLDQSRVEEINGTHDVISAGGIGAGTNRSIEQIVGENKNIGGTVQGITTPVNTAIQQVAATDQLNNLQQPTQGEPGKVWERPNTEQADNKAAKNRAFYEQEQADLQRKADELYSMEINPDANKRQVKQFRKKRVDLEIEKQLRAEAFRDGMGFNVVKYQSGQIENKPFANLGEILSTQSEIRQEGRDSTISVEGIPSSGQVKKEEVANENKTETVVGRTDQGRNVAPAETGAEQTKIPKSPYQEKIDQALSEGRTEVEMKWGDFEIRQSKINGSPSFSVINSKTGKSEGNFGSPETASIVAKRKSESEIPAAEEKIISTKELINVKENAPNKENKTETLVTKNDYFASKGFTQDEISEIENKRGEVKDLNSYARGRFGFERAKGIDFNQTTTEEPSDSEKNLPVQPVELASKINKENTQLTKSAISESISESELNKKQGKIGQKLSPGESVLTSSGRETTAFPKFYTSTGKTTSVHIKAIDSWLMNNAIEEARSKDDKFNLRQFEANKNKPSQSDKDSAEEYLFGNTQPTEIKFKPVIDDDITDRHRNNEENISGKAKSRQEIDSEILEKALADKAFMLKVKVKATVIEEIGEGSAIHKEHTILASKAIKAYEEKIADYNNFIKCMEG